MPSYTLTCITLSDFNSIICCKSWAWHKITMPHKNNRTNDIRTSKVSKCPQRSLMPQDHGKRQVYSTSGFFKQCNLIFHSLIIGNAYFILYMPQKPFYSVTWCRTLSMLLTHLFRHFHLRIRHFKLAHCLCSLLRVHHLVHIRHCLKTKRKSFYKCTISRSWQKP